MVESADSIKNRPKRKKKTEESEEFQKIEKEGKKLPFQSLLVPFPLSLYFKEPMNLKISHFYL